MGTNYWYTAVFSGTSSASPIVAGAAACCVGYWVANGNPVNTLTPALLRSTLSSTGTLQIYPPSGSIGTRPNLMGAFAYLHSVGIGPAAEPLGSVAMSVFPNPASEYLTMTLSFTTSPEDRSQAWAFQISWQVNRSSGTAEI